MENGTGQQLCAEDFNLLKQKVDDYVQQINLLSLENQELRAKLLSYEEKEVTLPRKIAKTSAEKCTVSKNSLNVRMSDNLHNKVNVNQSDIVQKSNNKKIIQAIDTNVFAVRQHIVNAKCVNFSVQQSSVGSPVKITINADNEVDAVRGALKEANVSYHEFKRKDEKCKCFLIRGLVGV